MFDSELELESDSKPRCSRTTMAILGAVGLIGTARAQEGERERAARSLLACS